MTGRLRCDGGGLAQVALRQAPRDKLTAVRITAEAEMQVQLVAARHRLRLRESGAPIGILTPLPMTQTAQLGVPNLAHQIARILARRS